MALETWLTKVKTTLTSLRATTPTTTYKMSKKSRSSHSHVGVLAFEIAGLMSKILHLWQSLSDKNVVRMRNEATSLEGVRKIVSNDESFLLGLACAEVVENVRIVAKSVSRLCMRSNNINLQSFQCLFEEFANSGDDPHRWSWSLKEVEVKLKKIDRYVTLTASLYKEMDELSESEHGLRKILQCSSDVEQLIKEKKIIDLQQRVFWQKQEVKYLKETSLWSRNFDMVALLLARSLFTILARIKLVFGIGSIANLPRSLSVSATVYPSDNSTCKFISGPLKMSSSHSEKHTHHVQNFFEANSKLLVPPETTLGGAALALHYANLIIVIEKMIRSPQLVGVDARDDLYGMLPSSIRVALRGRLKGVGFCASDPVLAGEWRDALGRILGWLSPLAHNMIKWQSERSFEQQSLTAKTNVLLLQTLYFANQLKTEAAITELLVGLNYIWRFEREMNAKALLEFSNFNDNIHMVEGMRR